MNAINTADFWNLLADSRLVDAGVAADLRREYERQPEAAAGSVAIAQWLVSRRVITLWQARRLARGERGPYFIGDYRLLSRVDTAGPGGLFRARHEPSGRVVHMAVLNAAQCRQLDVWTSIVRRTTLAHQATDPVLSRTWALEQAGTSRFIVCEDIPSQTLANELAKKGPIPLAAAGLLVLEVARAVAELHRLGEVHGAVSLDTVRRCPVPKGADPRSGGVRLAQFPLHGDPHLAIPRLPADQPALIEALGRRASFVAPELMLPGRVCDARSDVYSIGCVLYALVTGSLPCWQGDAQRTLAQAAFVGVPALAPPVVPVEIAALIGYLTARDPAGRYPSAAEAADAIAVCFGRPPVSPRLPAQRPFASAVVPPAASAVRAAQPTTATADMSQPFAEPSATFPHVTRSPRRTARPAPPKKNRDMVLWLMGLVAIGGLGTTAAVVLSSRPPRPSFVDASSPKPVGPEVDKAPDAANDDDRPVEGPTSRPDPSGIAEPERPSPPTDSPKLVDDPELPWGSPTTGAPPTFAYLAPGAQVILLARPADIEASDEGRLFVKALGPEIGAALDLAATVCGCGPEGIEEIQAGWQASETGGAIGSYALRLREPLDEAAIAQAIGGATAIDVGNATLHEGKHVSFWMPPADGGRAVVFGTTPTLREIIEADMTATDRRDDGTTLRAHLPRDMELLASMLDNTRHVTLIGAPRYLLNDGQGVLAGPLAKLVDPLGEFFGESVNAAALSLHFCEMVYAELDCIATIDDPAPRLARSLRGRIATLPDTVEEYCTRLDLAPYGRKLVMRLPAMVRILADATRVGVEGQGVVANCHLPRHAAHNLALATELALQQSAAASGQAPPATVATTAAAALQKRMTLTFAKDTLEKFIQMISDEIGVPMDIVGKDLELEGITKNQSFGLDERDKTADEVLRVILLKANPDRKLVYVIRKKDGAEVIEVTTRAAVTKRGDTLPAGFEADADPAKTPQKK